MSENINTIAESEYRFNEQALKLSKNFFNIEDTSMLKVGMFGYVTSIFSHMMRDTTFHRDMLYNEFFLNKASLNSTLYNWSKILNHPLNLVQPARLDVVLKLRLSDLHRYSTTDIANNNSKKFVINRDTTFILNGFRFLLPYEIQINLNGEYINALYNFNEYNLKPNDIKSPVLKVTSTIESGIKYALISFRIYQLEKSESITSMLSNEILDSSIIEETYNDGIASFNVSYSEEPSGGAFRNIQTIFNELSTNLRQEYCYYTFTGNNNLRIYFDSRPRGFRPKYNTRIKVEIFTSKASEANFNFNSEVIIQNDTIQQFSEYQIIPLSNKTYGGSQIDSFIENKITLIELLGTRNNITTSYDLQSFFRKMRNELNESNSTFQVVKTRDDILRRQFSAYILLKNSFGEVIPTNTIDLQFDIADLEKHSYSLKPGTLIVYDRSISKYRLLDEDELPEVYLNDKEGYLMCIPYLINFNFHEFPKANIFMTHYDKNIELSYTFYNTNAIDELIINDYKMYRNPINDIGHFTLSCDINSSEESFNRIKVLALLYHSNKPVGYTFLEREDSTNRFSTRIFTNDEFTPTGKYIIENSFKDVENNITISNLELDGQYKIKLAIFSNNGNNVNLPLVYDKIEGLDGLDIVCELESEEPIYFADDLTDLTYNQVNILSGSGKIQINKVPVISALFYLNDEYNTSIMNDMYSNLNLVRTIVNRLENNTSIDIKLMNTYGVSKYFTSDTVDLRLRFSVALNGTPTKELRDNIKADVVKFVEECNGKIDKRFSMSNLISFLEENYEEIKYIKIFTINGSGIQSVEQNNDYSRLDVDTLPYDYVPEYLTIRKTLANNSGDGDFSYDIVIDFI